MSVVSDSEGSHHSLAAGEFVISLTVLRLLSYLLIN